MHCSRVTLVLLVAWGGLFGSALPGAQAGEPQYELDRSFRAPVFTSFALAPRILVLPDDRFFAFSNLAPRGQSAFHRLNGVRCGNLVRFFRDGTVDPSFTLDEELFGYTINAVAIAPGGKFLVACVPPYRSTKLTNRVVRLNDDGSIDRTYDAGAGATPTANGACIIQAIAVDASGRAVIAGEFGDFNGSGRPWLLRLNADGAIDTAFARVTLGATYGSSTTGVLTNTGVALQPDGKVIIGGSFSQVNEVARPGVARLNDDGTLDTTFVPSGFDPVASPGSSLKKPVNSVAVRPSDGKIVIGGIFNPVSTGSSGGYAAQVVVRLENNGRADIGFDAGRQYPSYTCRGLALLENGDILTVSDYTVVRFKADGTLDTAFNSNVPASPGLRFVNANVQSDGKALIAGGFRSIGATAFSGVARLKADGAVELGFNPGELQRERLPHQLAEQKDGSIVAGGLFDRVDGVPRDQLAVLEPGGSLTARSYPSNVFGSTFLLQPGDKLLRWYRRPDDVFTCARFNSDSSIDSSFTADPRTIEFQDAKLQANGSYLLSTGQSTQAVANEVLLNRMQPDGSKDPTFDLGIEEQALVQREPHSGLPYRIFDGDNRVLAVLPGDKILYKYFSESRAYKVVLLGSNGAVDDGFEEGTATPRATQTIFPQVYDPQTGRWLQPVEGVVQPTSAGPRVILPEPDGGMLVAGQFTSYNGAAAGGIVRLNADGSLAATLGSGAAFLTTPITSTREPSITALKRDFANRILVVGDFEAFHGVPVPGMARLNADGSLDATFVPPVARRTTGVAFSDRSSLVQQGAGRFLLAGDYSESVGSSTATSIFRLDIPVRATALARSPGSGLSISFTGVPGETYKIERGENIASGAFNDTGALLLAAADGTFVYEDATAFSSLRRFYRAVSLD